MADSYIAGLVLAGLLVFGLLLMLCEKLKATVMEQIIIFFVASVVFNYNVVPLFFLKSY